MTLAAELSQYALAQRYSDLNEHTVHIAKQRLMTVWRADSGRSLLHPPAMRGRSRGNIPPPRPQFWAQSR
jgi:hypothetical protein